MSVPIQCTYTSEMYDRSALLSGAPLAGSGTRIERHCLEAMALPPHVHQKHLIVIHQETQPVLSRRQTGNHTETGWFRRGDVGLYPAGEYGPLDWDGPVDVIHIHLDAQELENTARRDLDLTSFTLHNQFQLEDHLISQLGQQLVCAIDKTHRLGQLYAESMISTLRYHLIEHHARFERRMPTLPNRQLPVATMARLEDYLDASLDQPVNLETLASLANLSVFHFARRFKLTTGCSPYQYVLGRKIQQARVMLSAGELPVAVIGDALGFNSPAHFSAVFKKAVGQTPSSFQQRPTTV